MNADELRSTYKEIFDAAEKVNAETKIIGPVSEEESATWNTRPIEDALRAEVAELRAFKEGVPWEDLESLLTIVFFATAGLPEAPGVTEATSWFDANRPQEPA